MTDLIGERNALEQTRIIAKGIDRKDLSNKFYKELIDKVYDNQLKRWTNYNRIQRRRCIKALHKSND